MKAFFLTTIITLSAISVQAQRIEQPVEIKPVRLVVDFSTAIMTTNKRDVPITDDYEPGRTYKANKDIVLYLQGSSLVVNVSGTVPGNNETIALSRGIIKIKKGETFTLQGRPGDFSRTTPDAINDRKLFNLDNGVKRK